MKGGSFPQYVDFFLRALAIRNEIVHVFLTPKCSSDHVERSFDNHAETFLLKIRSVFPQSAEKLMSS